MLESVAMSEPVSEMPSPVNVSARASATLALMATAPVASSMMMVRSPSAYGSMPGSSSPPGSSVLASTVSSTVTTAPSSFSSTSMPVGMAFSAAMLAATSGCTLAASTMSSALTG